VRATPLRALDMARMLNTALGSHEITLPAGSMIPTAATGRAELVRAYITASTPAGQARELGVSCLGLTTASFTDTLWSGQKRASYPIFGTLPPVHPKRKERERASAHTTSRLP
jgi:hypothetical protein